MDFEVTVSVRVTNTAGAAFTVVDTQISSTGDNPSYVADYAGAAVADVADRVHATLLDRFGHRPADGGSGVGYYPGPDRGRFVRPTATGDTTRPVPEQFRAGYGRVRPAADRPPAAAAGPEREATPPQTPGDV